MTFGGREGERHAVSWWEMFHIEGTMTSNALMDGFVKGKWKFINSAIVKCSLDVRYNFKIRNGDNSIDYMSSVL